ncbi:preprotein translocase subunit SecG [bacterium]|nr:preprotein translocase subunit SecG [bacterium]|tara:strand:+ start:7117 stop:7425 length:309 start_codon:yes stop_codon:yes gene_type:complete
MIETIKGSLIIFHGVVAILLVLSVLFQPSKSDDLGSMFGGSSESVFGADSSSFLRKLTKWLGAIFILSSISLGYLYIKFDKTSVVQEKIKILEEQEEVSDID